LDGMHARDGSTADQGRKKEKTVWSGGVAYVYMRFRKKKNRLGSLESMSMEETRLNQAIAMEFCERRRTQQNELGGARATLLCFFFFLSLCSFYFHRKADRQMNQAREDSQRGIHLDVEPVAMEPGWQEAGTAARPAPRVSGPPARVWRPTAPRNGSIDSQKKKRIVLSRRGARPRPFANRRWLGAASSGCWPAAARRVAAWSTNAVTILQADVHKFVFSVHKC
jgi:hypothetical protein